VTHEFRPPPDWVKSCRRWETCRQCGVRSYQTRGDARRVRRLQVAQFGVKLSELQVYRCRRGTGAFHIGWASPDPAQQKAEAS
jgi:hypothetical protein